MSASKVFSRSLTMEVSLPVSACWVQGQRANSHVLIDPYNIKMKYKDHDVNNMYYFCSKKKDLECRVSVTIKKETANANIC